MSESKKTEFVGDDGKTYVQWMDGRGLVTTTPDLVATVEYLRSIHGLPGKKYQ